ncbi:MAG TPA: LPS export ABC transporter periplasmic protein LptC [Bryobacteraceae bacterium]
MRRISVLLAGAVILLTVAVAYTYKLSLDRNRRHHPAPVPHIAKKYRGEALQGWRWNSDDAETNKPVVRATAKSYHATDTPSTLDIQGLRLRLYDKKASSYTYVTSDQAVFDEASEILKSAGPVTIVMNVPADKDIEDKAELAKRVRVTTSGVTYETKTGKATTDQPATFQFPNGGGKAVGVEYDPNTKTLHLKSAVAMDWVGDGPQENKMHVEAGDLVYKELEQKIYLSPWSKMQRQTLTILAQGSVVTLEDQRLHQIVSEHPVGTDDRNGRKVEFRSEQMTALFNEDGDLVQVLGNQNARVVSSDDTSQTTMTGDKADLRFALDTEEVNGQEKVSSDLHLVMADGHGEAVSEPLPAAKAAHPDGVPETRILRSEHIELEMKPGGRDVQEIRTSTQAQLEFKPNRAGQTHRILDASRLRILYGEGSYIDTFLAWNVATHTDKPAVNRKTAAPALTWSDQMTAKFSPNSSQIATIDQEGNFRYQEGARTARARKAFLEQTANRITLTEKAEVADDSGVTHADQIVMDQMSGDMDATGHVLSTHAPNKNQKPGTSMLDTSQPMQASAEEMHTRESNSQVSYRRHAVMWQGANRISADRIDIDRDEQSLHAVGNVVSELVDNKAGADAVFTMVKAPDLVYRDDTREALYTGGVTLVRGKMTVTSKQVRAFLTPKAANNSDDSSLDHAFADGDVVVTEILAGNRKRSGTSEHGEYYTKDDKVVLNGGSPQIIDSIKGMTRGRQLTYFTEEDHLIVEGENKKVAFTRMKKK